MIPVTADHRAQVDPAQPTITLRAKASRAKSANLEPPSGKYLNSTFGLSLQQSNQGQCTGTVGKTELKAQWQTLHLFEVSTIRQGVVWLLQLQKTHNDSCSRYEPRHLRLADAGHVNVADEQSMRYRRMYSSRASMNF